jgi:hypothetical protein
MTNWAEREMTEKFGDITPKDSIGKTPILKIGYSVPWICTKKSQEAPGPHEFHEYGQKPKQQPGDDVVLGKPDIH